LIAVANDESDTVVSASAGKAAGEGVLDQIRHGAGDLLLAAGPKGDDLRGLMSALEEKVAALPDWCSGYVKSGWFSAKCTCGAENKEECEAAVVKAKIAAAAGTVFTFVFCSGGKDGFDQKGIFYYLGTLLGTPGPWVNPGESGLVDCKWSSVGYNGGPEYYFLDHLGGKSSCTDNSPGQWMQVDLKDVRLANPTHYCLRHGYWNDGRYRLVSWVLSASVDGKVWVEIDVQSNSTSPFPDSGYSTAAFPIGGAAAGQGEGFRFFRLTQTGKNSSGLDGLNCGGFELYGTLVARN
jgi:hypothetical protein